LVTYPKGRQARAHYHSTERTEKLSALAVTGGIMQKCLSRGGSGI